MSIGQEIFQPFVMFGYSITNDPEKYYNLSTGFGRFLQYLQAGYIARVMVTSKAPEKAPEYEIGLQFRNDRDPKAKVSNNDILKNIN